jgi:hypothetical protein
MLDTLSAAQSLNESRHQMTLKSSNLISLSAFHSKLLHVRHVSRQSEISFDGNRSARLKFIAFAFCSKILFFPTRLITSCCSKERQRDDGSDEEDESAEVGGMQKAGDGITINYIERGRPNVDRGAAGAGKKRTTIPSYIFLKTCCPRQLYTGLVNCF